MNAVVNVETPVKGKHWEYWLVPAGGWRRTEHQTRKIEDGTAEAVFESEEARPHFVPLTKTARGMAAYDPPMGCRGQVLLDGEWVWAARFVYVPADRIQELLDDLDAVVERLSE